MHKALIVVIAAAAVGFGGNAVGQRAAGSSVQYRWHDGQGLVHYSDSLSSEAMTYGYDVVNGSGLVVRHVERQLTAKERAIAQKQAADAAARKRADDERMRADQQMLAAYPDEADFIAEQQGELASIDQQIATTRSSLRTQEKALTDLLDRAGELERAKQPVPKFLADRIAEQRNVVGGQRALLDRLLASYVTTQLKNDAQLQRYRAMKAQQPDDDTPAGS